MKHIKTLEDACKALGTTVEEQFPAGAMQHLSDDEKAYREMKLIAKALNLSEDGKVWEPDWSNWDERKYFPWMEVQTSEDNGAGSGFSCFDCDYDGTYTCVGSRLCFRSSELAMYAGKQFADVYKRFWLIGQ